MATREDIKNIMAYMALAFPNYKPDVSSGVNTVDVLFDLLGDLDAEVLKLAVRSACAEPGRQFAPSAGEIRGAMGRIRSRLAGVPTAAEAWGEVIGSFERMPGGNMAGGGHTPILDHPLVKQAVHCIGGYAAIGMDFYENQGMNRAHFLRIYNELLDKWQGETAELPALTDYISENKQITDSVKMLTAKLEMRK